MGDETGLPAGSELQRWVRLRLRLDAPPQRVLRAWSDPEELARWFPERVEGGSGGRVAIGPRLATATRLVGGHRGPRRPTLRLPLAVAGR